jgi:hypothetical protein
VNYKIKRRIENKVNDKTCKDWLLCVSLAIQAEPLNCLDFWLHLCGNGKGGNRKVTARARENVQCSTLNAVFNVQ